MSFVDPVTIADPVTGTHAASTLLTAWRSDQQLLRGPKAGCRVRTNVATVLGAGSVVPCELEDFDNNGCHDTAVNNSRLTVPAGWGGTFRFGFDIWVSSSTTFRVIKNGNPAAASALLIASTMSSNPNLQSAVGSDRAVLVAGDYIELYTVNAVTVNVATFRPVFWMQWRSP